MNIADTVRANREAAGLSMQQLAKGAGLSNAYISHLESGRIVNPSVPKLKKIATYLKIDASVLTDADFGVAS